ncbi:MAG: DUF1501 domain-containing protein [Acidobacteria bacterium]|nr:DUF1501 domain-containing protein [Acidobacteriota bacterium]
MMSRRVFVRESALALVSLGFAPSFLTRTAAAGSPRRKILIAIFQRGAVDGLNMIVPFGDRAYYAARPSIAIARPGSTDGSAVDLDGFFGLHPRLAPLAPLYKEGHLAIVHACGSHDSTRSHFDAQDYMETATPGVKSTQDGWLNRCVRERARTPSPDAAATPFRAVALTTQMPRILQGTAPAVAMNQIGQFGIRAGDASGAAQSSFESEYTAAADAVLSATGREAFDAIRLLEQADPGRYEPAGGVAYPRSVFGQALKQIAQLVKADVGLEIAFAESSGWDHHVNEGAATGQIATRLDDLARGVAALAADLGDRLDDVVILTMSEFGRAVAENGNRGTDHGHANAMMAIGGPVRGGKVYGTWPGLEVEQRFERRDLAVTTDFRDVFGEVVVRHLGVKDAASIFPGFAIREQNFQGFVRL